MARDRGHIPLFIATLLAAVSIALNPAMAQVLLDDIPEDARGLDVTERLGERIPLELAFESAEGKRVPLSTYFGEKPVVLALVYYSCPIVCDLVMDRMARSFNELDFTIGEDFNVVVVSFDHTESSATAASVKMLYTSGYNRPVSQEVLDGWGFHTGDAGSVRALADSVGYDYRRLSNGEYAHPVSLMVLAPDGTVSRYLYGFDYPAREMKLSLLNASDGKIAKSLGDRFLHFCYRYDPDAGAYSLQAMRVMQIGAAATVLFLGGLIGGLFVFERVRRRAVRAMADARATRDAEPAPRVITGQAT